MENYEVDKNSRHSIYLAFKLTYVVVVVRRANYPGRLDRMAQRGSTFGSTTVTDVRESRSLLFPKDFFKYFQL